MKTACLVFTLVLLCTLVLGVSGCGADASSTTVAVQTTIEPTTTAGTSPTTTYTTPSELVVTGGDILLRIRVTDQASCFLIVNEDDKYGRTLFSGTLASGQESEFMGRKSYCLYTGSPDVIRVFVNDREFPIEGRGGYFIVTETAVERIE